MVLPDCLFGTLTITNFNDEPHCTEMNRETSDENRLCTSILLNNMG